MVSVSTEVWSPAAMGHGMSELFSAWHRSSVLSTTVTPDSVAFVWSLPAVICSDSSTATVSTHDFVLDTQAHPRIPLNYLKTHYDTIKSGPGTARASLESVKER